MHVLPVNHLILWKKLSDIEGSQMVGGGEEQREPIPPEFDRSIMTDFQGPKITSDTRFLLLEHAPFHLIPE
jgi:hypothetical protein